MSWKHSWKHTFFGGLFCTNANARQARTDADAWAERQIKHLQLPVKVVARDGYAAVMRPIVDGWQLYFVLPSGEEAAVCFVDGRRPPEEIWRQHLRFFLQWLSEEQKEPRDKDKQRWWDTPDLAKLYYLGNI